MEAARVARRGSPFLVPVVVAIALVTFGGAARIACNLQQPCVSDLPSLYAHRGIDPSHPPYFDRNLEYPVGLGYVFYALTFPATSPRAFFVVAGIGFAALAGIVAWLLARRYGARAWWWALSPPLALYGTLNFDLVAVALTVGGLLAFTDASFVLAGVLLGVGTATKLYPGAILLVLTVDRLGARDRRSAVRLVGSAAATLLVLNLPVLVATPRGWLWPYRFQAERRATWASLWHYVGRTPDLHRWLAASTERSVVDAGALVVLAVGTALVAHRVWRRRVDPIAAAAVVTGVFLLANKVYSPQYDLWLVPFFVMLVTPWRRIVSFLLADAAVFALVTALLRHAMPGTLGWRRLLFGFVVWRAASIIVLLVGWLRLAPNLPATERAGSEPPLAADGETSWASSTARSR